MAIKYTIPRGTFDVLPKDSYKWRFVENLFRQTVELYGYQEIMTPIFEQADLFERSVGDTSDIVQKEMYKFSDRKGRTFALRPEGTAGVVRSYVENNLAKDADISKLYYYGQMFRYDRPQAGRSRQFSQLGLEAIGSNHPYVDAEVIAIFYTFLKNLHLKNYRVEINSIGCPDCTQDYNKALIEYYTPYKNDLCPDCLNRLVKNPKRLIDCKVPKCKESAANAPFILDYLDEKCKAHFDSVKKYLDLAAIPYIINPRIVRGLDYYSQTAFEVVYEGLGAQNALGGGGRYNGLIEQVGGTSTPAIGFAIGITRIILALEQENLSLGTPLKPKYYFVALGERARVKAVSLIQLMRESGISVAFDIQKESIKAQMKAANRLEASCALILGDNELDNNIIIAKNMADGSQKEINLTQLLTDL